MTVNMKSTKLINHRYCDNFGRRIYFNSKNQHDNGIIGNTTFRVLVITTFIVLANRGYKVDAMALKTSENETTVAPVTIEGSVFELSSQLDEDDMLQEYGRFMLSHMNRSIDPCENFYEYSCGNWKQAALVPSQVRNDTFLHSIQISINQLMTSFLGNVTSPEDTEKLEKDNSAEAKAKRFFKSCVLQNKNLNIGYKKFIQMKQFQVELESKNNETLDWININFLMPYGLYPFVPLRADYNAETRRVELLLGTPLKVLGNLDTDNVNKMILDLGIQDETEQKQLYDELEEMLDFEKELIAHSTERNETEQLTLGDFIKTHSTDNLNWTRFFDVAFKGSVKSEWIIHNSLDNIDKLEKFVKLKNLSFLRDYVKYRTLIEYYQLWKSDFGNISLENTCREHTEQYFNKALVPWFLKNAYDADRRADILKVSLFIKEHFYELIDNHTWLDDDTKSGARSKINSMDFTVGYSDEMRHKEIVDLVYNDLKISSTEWFENLFVLEENLEKVRMNTVHETTITPVISTSIVNGYYIDFLNLVFLPAGLAQMPFYHIHFPPALKFGGIGNIVGHEMAHGFDTTFYKFNYDGRKQNWWSTNSLRNFRERYQCLESQYNKLIYHGVATNGNQTSGDNIADNVGTRIAYHAYLKAYGQQDGDQKPIPGVDYTNKQLYFLQFAQTWCSGKDDAYKLKIVQNDVHAYDEFRVIGTLRNMPEFSEVFQCKLGSDMNPLRKCIVW